MPAASRRPGLSACFCAGFNGFVQARGNALETKYVRGSHGAALVAQNIPSIVDFIINEQPTPPPDEILTNWRSTLMEYSSRACWIIWLVLIAAAVALGWMWNLMFHTWLLPLLPVNLDPYSPQIAFAAYAAVLLLVLRYL